MTVGLLVELFAQSKLYRAQTAVLLVAVLLPSVANVLFTAGYRSARIGPTPIAIALGGTPSPGASSGCASSS